MERISKDEYYLNIAKAVSERSTCLKRKYGCVIVNNDRIVATGYNGSPRGADNCCDIYLVCPRRDKPHNSGDYSNCPAVHAEQNALLSASSSELQGATLYLNGVELDENDCFVQIKEVEPCPICKNIILNSGIAVVVTPSDYKIVAIDPNHRPFLY